MYIEGLNQQNKKIILLVQGKKILFQELRIDSGEGNYCGYPCKFAKIVKMLSSEIQ